MIAAATPATKRQQGGRHGCTAAPATKRGSGTGEAATMQGAEAAPVPWLQAYNSGTIQRPLYMQVRLPPIVV